MYAIEAQNVTKIIRGRTILNNVSLCVEQGEAVGIAGRNGIMDLPCLVRTGAFRSGAVFRAAGSRTILSGKAFRRWLRRWWLKFCCLFCSERSFDFFPHFVFGQMLLGSISGRGLVFIVHCHLSFLPWYEGCAEYSIIELHRMSAFRVCWQTDDSCGQSEDSRTSVSGKIKKILHWEKQALQRGYSPEPFFIIIPTGFLFVNTFRHEI